MKNKRLALKLLAKDCELAEFYVKGGKTCAVGCLALASGVSARRLRRTNGESISSWELLTVRDRIWEKFKLSMDQLRRIQCANDNSHVLDGVGGRRKAVLKIVKAIPTT